ncbi:MAG TPA: M20/M25/M40 family metallo-hydrolase, partial [Trueperaceae bacterium]|nr:M20/M25/M40 family metallo-hydrolase [Trueperaceae bacterium]
MFSYLKNNKERQLNELIELLKIPSVSTDVNHNDDLVRAANYLINQLDDLGFATELRATAGHPIVLANYIVDKSLPTVLIYGHYDVQPVDPISEWSNPPFEPTIKDGKIFARGASDDKGQIFAHIKAVEALIKTTNTLPVNVKFLIEGEEEIGSPNLGPFLIQEKENLACELVLISDSAMIAPDTPTITYGLKGLAYIELEVIAANRDLHSGAYGGGVPNPINVLAKMIASLHDENGKITVPGFYDDVIEISSQEKAAFEKVPFDEKEFAEEIALKGTPGEAGYTVLERIWARPTLDVNGIKGG